jgi:hypothetical protein
LPKIASWRAANSSWLTTLGLGLVPLLISVFLIWCAGWESNPLPIVLEATALTLWATSAVYYFNAITMNAAVPTNMVPPNTTDNKSIAVSIVVPCV